jgi:predicted CXXCH cytochrome family protein
MYSSNTINATAVTAPNAGSLTCLGCHDGVTAMDNYGGVTTGSQPMGAVAARLTRDLSDDHPVSILYDNALFVLDNSLVDPASGGNTAAPLLRNGRVQCASCHDPHGKPGLAKFLRIDNTGSNLCVQCHNK